METAEGDYFGGLVVPEPGHPTVAEQIADEIAREYNKACETNPGWMPPPDLRPIIVKHIRGKAIED